MKEVKMVAMEEIMEEIIKEVIKDVIKEVMEQLKQITQLKELLSANKQYLMLSRRMFLDLN